MTSKYNSSPKFKNVSFRPKQSPQEIKDKMRKNYRTKIQNCRELLLDQIRGNVAGKNLQHIKEFYRSMLNYPIVTFNEEETEVLDELKNELLQEELQWLLNEYEQSIMGGVDWSATEEDNNVICPICQKENFKLIDKNITCSRCEYNIATEKSLLDIKVLVISYIEQHNGACSHESQFTMIPDSSGAHMYLICEYCNDMKLVL